METSEDAGGCERERSEERSGERLVLCVSECDVSLGGWTPPVILSLLSPPLDP